MSKVANQCLDLSNYSFKFTNEAAKSCPPVYKKGSHSVPRWANVSQLQWPWISRCQCLASMSPVFVISSISGWKKMWKYRKIYIPIFRRKISFERLLAWKKKLDRNHSVEQCSKSLCHSIESWLVDSQNPQYIKGSIIPINMDFEWFWT